MNAIHRSKLRHVALTLATGDLFGAQVDSIVSSEQTDFILSRDPRSLSGQIWDRYGDAVQQELDAATKGQVLGLGTVIDTSGGEDFKRIFHAGFHEPYYQLKLLGELSDSTDPSGSLRESRETDYFAAIGSCIRQVLDAAISKELKSVAFPLIGCGLFGLDEKLLVLQFLDVVEEFDNKLADGESLDVWLVIRDRTQFDSVAGVLLDLLIQAGKKLVSVRMKPIGVPILDRFARRLSERTNEEWAKWQLCRYAEIGVEFMCYGLSRASRPAATPESLFKENLSPTFGIFLERAHELVTKGAMDVRAWGASAFTRVLRDSKSAQALNGVVAQRNHLAHGRKAESLTKIKSLVTLGLQLESWERIIETDGELRLLDWRPWIVTSPSNPPQVGLFERLENSTIRYLIPETGEIFIVPRVPGLES
jgi:hypothetical protein